MKMVTPDQIRALNESRGLHQPLTIVKTGIGYELTYRGINNFSDASEVFSLGISAGYWDFDGDSNTKEFTVFGRANTTVCVIRGLLDQS